MSKMVIRQAVTFRLKIPALEWLQGEASKQDISVNELLNRLLLEKADEVAD